MLNLWPILVLIFYVTSFLVLMLCCDVLTYVPKLLFRQILYRHIYVRTVVGNCFSSFFYFSLYEDFSLRTYPSVLVPSVLLSRAVLCDSVRRCASMDYVARLSTAQSTKDTLKQVLTRLHTLLTILILNILLLFL